MDLEIKQYHPEMKEKWDEFVMTGSINGTFLQTKKFLDYHGTRFEDTSLALYKGSDTIVAVIPACTLEQDNKKIFSAHIGSTFGGIVVGKQFYNIAHMEAIIDTLEDYFVRNKYDEVFIKCTSEIFQTGNSNLLYYYLFQRGFVSYDELSCYIDFKDYEQDILENLTSSRRRDYKYSLKNNLIFRQIFEDEEIKAFYKILCCNLEKFQAKPIHSLEEIFYFRDDILKDIVEFYGVFFENNMIAGSMVFNFSNSVFHTQYLAASPERLKLFPMNFLDVQLIQTARDRKFNFFSFGTSTEMHGRILNKNLAQFKEGFGTKYGINKTFVKKYDK